MNSTQLVNSVISTMTMFPRKHHDESPAIPLGRDLHEGGALPRCSRHDNVIDWIQFENPGLNIDAKTCVPRWYAGENIDWCLVVGALFELQS